MKATASAATEAASPWRRTSGAAVAEIYAHMSRERRRQLHFLLLLMLLNAGAEFGTIGALLPLLMLISHPQALEHYASVSTILRAFGAETQGQRLVAATAIFSAFAIASGFLRFELSRSTFNFGYGLAHELALEIQQRLLLQPYSFHIQRNSSTLVSSLEKVEILVFDVWLPLMQALSAAFISLFIISILILINPVTAWLATTAFTIIYVAVSAMTKSRLASNSQAVSFGIHARLKILQESLGGIRDVLIDGTQNTYLSEFDRENSRLARAFASTAVISLAPRFLMETIGIVAVAMIALVASLEKGGFAAALPELGALALGAQRLLPLIQQVYKGWSTASGHLSVMGETVDLLTLPVDERHSARDSGPPLVLRHEISVENVGFTYPSRRSPTLHGVSLNIPLGAALAVTGETGSGKTTFADLLIGLLEPSEGEIRIDGVRLTDENCRRWQRNIAHVPQSIFLVDATITRNICLSVPDKPPNHDRLIDAAKKAQLHEFITSLPDGYDTRVGERGIRLSGGQRQRLGIARAIYKDASVFVLDEATSALDEDTEAAVIASLDELRRQGRTLIMIAHRQSTIRHCDLVARFDKGRVVECGSLTEILKVGKQSS